jgi:manganese/iron transport system substrate-binding protein
LKKIINFKKEVPMLRRSLLMILLAFSLLASACGAASAPGGEGKLLVVATMPVVSDVVRQVGGDFVRVETLLPIGGDVHQYVPRPQDSVMVSKARLIFAHGAGLETFLEPILENAGAKDRLIEVARDVPLIKFEGAESEHQGEQQAMYEHGFDPHTWLDPNNVMIWADTIAEALSQADPAHASVYRKNAEACKAQLKELDAWIREQVAQIPPERRKLVTDHRAYGYFAQRYGFEQIGAVLPSFSTEAASSAQELAALEQAIRSYGVPVIFVEEIGNRALAEQIARDTGVRLVQLYHDLGPAGSEADTYLKFMRYNVTQIVQGLK